MGGHPNDERRRPIRRSALAERRPSKRSGAELGATMSDGPKLVERLAERLVDRRFLAAGPLVGEDVHPQPFNELGAALFELLLDQGRTVGGHGLVSRPTDDAC